MSITREEVERRLRKQFEDSLDDKVWDALHHEQDEAVEAFLEEWEERRGEEIREGLEDKFEEDLDEAIELAMEDAAAA